MAIGIQVWVEYTFGFSYHAYCGIDAYQRIFSAETPPPEQEAHFLLNTELPVWQRQPTVPEHWWQYKFWQSYGQHSTVDEWVVSVDTRDATDQSIVAFRDIPRMRDRITMSSVLRNKSLAMELYSALRSDQERKRFLQMIKQVSPQLGIMIEDRSRASAL